jgi:acetylornithine deacetylase/succinyl-diaminopimelate desuccinylase-like protein
VIESIDVDRQALIDLCLSLGNLRDYPGHESDVGDAVADWLSNAGISVRKQTLSYESINVVGMIRGVGDRKSGGRSLILNAHMDTQGDEPASGEEVEKEIRGAWTEDGLLYGRGLANDKAQLAATLIAARAVATANIALKEDLFVTAVAQETSAPRGARRALAGRKWGRCGLRPCCRGLGFYGHRGPSRIPTA